MMHLVASTSGNEGGQGNAAIRDDSAGRGGTHRQRNSDSKRTSGANTPTRDGANTPPTN